MRIVYLHQYFATPGMAGGTRSYEMARRLVRLGHEVHMVTSDRRPAGSGARQRISCEAGIQVHWIPVPYSNSMGYGARIRAFLRFAALSATQAARLAPDVIFATSTPLTIALPALYASWRRRCPMVFEIRDLWPDVPIAIGALPNPLARRAALWLERTAYRRAARVVALAPGMKDHVVSKGIAADRVSVIPNGCDLDLFAPSALEPRPREADPWIGDRPLVVFCGTFGLVNGVDYLPRLAAALLQLDPAVRLVGIGTGREWNSTRKLAAELGVLDVNLRLLGEVPKEATVAWMRAADATLALFTGPEIIWRDAVQNKFFDSLAAGTPVINNFRGWQAIVAEEAGAGLIVSGTDVAAAATVIAARLRDRQWVEAAGAQASRLAAERFNLDRLAVDLEGVLLAAAGPRPGGRS
jgi:glycosyltransferase involved in cell wall biosynthesis